MSWFVLMASWFSIKMLLLRSPFGFNTEKKYDEKKTGAMRNFKFRKHELYERWKSILKEILWQAIAASLNGIDELVLLLLWRNHGYINFCPLLLAWDILSIRFYITDWEPEVLKQLDPHKIFVRKLGKLMRFRIKVALPNEFFQLSKNSVRKLKTNHILVKPSSNLMSSD